MARKYDITQYLEKGMVEYKIHDIHHRFNVDDLSTWYEIEELLEYIINYIKIWYLEN